MIRLKVFIPFLLITALIAWIVIYKIDFWLKGWIEDGISSVTETKTDISGLKLSFMNSSLVIRRLEVASKADEFKNALELDNVIVDFQSLPLLYKRVVVDNFSVLGIQWGTTRRTSGKLPPRKKNNKPSWFSEQAGIAFESLKAEVNALPVKKLLDFEIPSDPKEIVDSLDLKSDEAFKAVVAESQQLGSSWTERVKDAGDLKLMEAQVAQARALTQNLPQNPEEILQRAQTVQKTVQFLGEEKTKAETIVQDVERDSNRIQNTFATAQKVLEADLQKAKKAVSLDQLNVDNLSKLIFGVEWINRAEEVLRYHKILRDVLAKTKPDDDVQVQERAKGRDIIFITPKKEPSFVLAKSEFSVKARDAASQNLVSALYELKLLDVNSSPMLYGKPTSIDLKAQFKKAMMAGIDFSAFFDYTKDIPKDDFTLAVHKIQASNWPVGIPKVFPAKILKGTADAKSEMHFVGDEMKWKNSIQFAGVEWDFSAVPKQGILLPILEDVFKKISQFHLNLELKWVDGKLAFLVSSDLDNAIKTGIMAAIEKQFAEFQARLQREVELRVATLRDDATKQMASFKTTIADKAGGHLKAVAGYSEEAKNIEATLKREAQSKVENKAKDELKKNIPTALPSLPKKLPF